MGVRSRSGSFAENCATALKPLAGLKPLPDAKRAPVLPLLKEASSAVAQSKTKQLPFASLGASTDSTKVTTTAKTANPKDLTKDLCAQPSTGTDTVSALFVAKYATAKEIKRNEKRQDKIQKKLA